MRGDVKSHHPKEGAVLGLPPILLVSAQSRRNTMVAQVPQKAKSPDELTEATTPTEYSQSTYAEKYNLLLQKTINYV